MQTNKLECRQDKYLTKVSQFTTIQIKHRENKNTRATLDKRLLKYKE